MRQIFVAGMALVMLVVMPLSGVAGSGRALTPLGLVLGSATLGQVRAELGSITQLESAGVNADSDGPMLRGDGNGLGIEGLKQITFIFDPKERLVGVIMKVSNGRFDDVYSHLASKYTLESKDTAVFGNKYIRFAQENGVVEMDVPRWSFEMEIRYLTHDLFSRFHKDSLEGEAPKKGSERSKF